MRRRLTLLVLWSTLCALLLAGCGAITTPPTVTQRWMYVLHVSLNQIRVYPLSASGTVTRARVIGGPHTRLSGPGSLALDKNRNLYVGNQGDLHGITVYSPDANGDVAPIHIIAGSATQMIASRGLAFDDCGYLYVLDSLDNEVAPTQESALTFNGDANGNVAPLGVLSGSNTGTNLARAMVHVPGGLYVAQEGTSRIIADELVPKGTVTPTAVLAGGATNIEDPMSLASDPTTGALFETYLSEQLNAFPAHPNGTIPPTRTVQESDYIIDVGVDRGGNTSSLINLFQEDPATTPCVYVYGPSDITPSRTMTVAELIDPTVILVDDAVSNGGTSLRRRSLRSRRSRTRRERQSAQTTRSLSVMRVQLTGGATYLFTMLPKSTI
jgi:hypothetical protein